MIKVHCASDSLEKVQLFVLDVDHPKLPPAVVAYSRVRARARPKEVP